MFGLFKRVQRDDPVFGQMLYMGDKLGYWEGNAYFPPTQTDVEVFVDGSSSDNMTQQHGFYESICRYWSEWAPQLTAKVRRENELGNGEELRLSSLSIPSSQFKDSTEWEVSFSAHPSGDSYSVQMKGASTQSVNRDT